MSLQAELDSLRVAADPAYLEEIAAAAAYLTSAGVPERAKRIGQAAPDFALSGADHEVAALSDLLRHGPVVISFFRGEWCSFCRAELDALLAAQPEMAALGATLLLVSPEAPSDALVAAVGGKTRVHLLRDPMLGVALAYGLVYLVPHALRLFYLGTDFDLARDLSTGSWLLPVPGDFVVDSDGTIVLSYVDTDFTHRLDPLILVETLVGLQRGL